MCLSAWAEVARECDIPLRQLMIRIRQEDIGLPPPGYWEMTAGGLSRTQALKQIGWTTPMIRKVSGILKDTKEQKKRSRKKVHK